MIDTERRKRLALHLRHLSDGVIPIDDFELRVTDDVTYGWRPEQYHHSKQAATDDAAIVPLLLTGWRLYSGVKNDDPEDTNQVDEASRGMIGRCILFLHSDLEYRWPAFEPSGISKRDLLLYVLTLGYWSKRKRRETEQSYSEWQKNGDFDVWPFLKTEDYAVQLVKRPFMDGAA